MPDDYLSKHALDKQFKQFTIAQTWPGCSYVNVVFLTVKGLVPHCKKMGWGVSVKHNGLSKCT